MDTANNLANADPSGFVPAALAAVRLVGAVAKVAPTVVHAVDSFKNHNNAAHPGSFTHSNSGGNLSRSVSQPQEGYAAPVQIEPEAENRAYETVNYVLRTLGNRIGEAGLVSAPALAKALTAASTHIEVELFSVNANRLFKSLASKLQDAVLVNSVFTSIYFIGAITAELSRSLPNYKPTYVPLGPCIVQHIFRAAIGEDAFRENQRANIEAYKTLATTAGLLRPTDLGYSIFPDFPSLSPTRYSSKSYSDVRNHKNIFEKLIKHFDIHGFPQPLPGRDVGPIKDWRFLSGDANSRWYEVEKADKHIGESIGRVLYWLICGADRMPAGMGVIAYYKQHIELIQWMGTRFGYRVLTASDLDMSGPHLRLENKYRATVEAWVVICPSLTGHINKRQTAVDWHQIAPPTPVLPQNSDISISHRPSISSSIISMENSTMNALKLGLNTPATQQNPKSIGIGSAIANAGAAARRTESYPKPNPVAGLAALSSPIDSFTASPTTGTIVNSPESQSTAATPATPTTSETASMSPPPYKPTASPKTSTVPLASSMAPSTTTAPSYFPTMSYTNPGANVGPSQPVGNKPRRKAPPPPRKFTTAKALYDFAPSEEGGEELTFKEGDDIEIVEKSADLEADGWCKARVKGSIAVGLAPLDYLEEVKAPPRPAAAPQRPQAPPPVAQTSSSSAPPTTRSLSGGPGSTGARGIQTTAISRSVSTSSATARSTGTMQPQLIGIHEHPQQPHLHQLHTTSNSSQTTNPRPQSVAIPNSYSQTQSHIPINSQMQNNQFAHPVHSTHPTPINQQNNHVRPSPAQQSAKITQQPSESMLPQSYYPQVSDRPQPAELFDSDPSRISAMAGGSTSVQSSSTQGNVPNRISTPIQRPSSTQSSQPQNSPLGQQSQGLVQSPDLAASTSSRQISNTRVNSGSNHHNFAPNISLNLGGHSSSGMHPGSGVSSSSGMHSGSSTQSGLGSQSYFHHTQPSHFGGSALSTHASPNNSFGSTNNYGSSSSNQQYNNQSTDPNYNSQGYNAVDPNANLQSYNPMDPSAGLSGANGYQNPYTGGNQNASGGPSYVYEPTTIETGSDGGGELVTAGMSYLAGASSDSGDGDAANPASSMNFSTDLAAIDPFYAAMNPGFASAGPATPTDTSAGPGQSFGDANSGQNNDAPASPLASLSLGDDNASEGDGDQGTATDALGNAFGSSPLSGLAQNNGSSTSLGGTGGNSWFGGGMANPLAGLAQPNNDFGGGTNQVGNDMGFGNFGDQDVSYEQTTTTYMQDDATSNGDQSSVFMEQDTTTTYSDMGDNDDDGFGYS